MPEGSLVIQERYRESIETLEQESRDWNNGVCPICEGDGRQHLRNSDGSFGPPEDCRFCGGTGNVVDYMREVLLPMYSRQEELWAVMDRLAGVLEALRAALEGCRSGPDLNNRIANT